MFRTALAAIALAATPSPAAPDPVQGIGVAVDFAGLDRSRPEHREILARGLMQTSRKACGTPFIRDVVGLAAYQECVSDALRRGELAAR